jgi:ABC-type glycerol-3-phosphate transport system substrate-binding protein
MGSTSKTATRVLGIATAAALALTASACSSGKSSSGAAAGSGAKGGGSFTYWSMWRADEPQATVLKQAIADFTAATGTKVDVQWVGRDVKKKIGPAIAANQAPDLWDQGDNVIYASTAQSGQAMDLSPVLAMTIPTDNVTVGSVIPSKYTDALPKDPSGTNHYVIPYEIASEGLFYNNADPDIAAAMPTPATTWADFMKVCDALKAKGKACITSDGELAWENGLTLDYLLQGAGVDVSALFNDKTGAAWDDPKVATAVGEMAQLVKGGYIDSGYDATKFPAQETNWATGKTAGFYSDGSWVTDEIKKEVPSTWKTGTILPPGANVADAGTFGFGIPKKAKNSAAAEQFIAFFLQKKELTGIATTAGNITPRSDIAAPAELADIAKILNASTTVRSPYPGLAGDEEPKVWDPNFLDLWHGKDDAAAFISKTKAAQIAYWKTQS